MISGRLTMRAHVERNVATGKDGWNQPVAPDYQPLAVLPCFAWSPAAREIMDGDKVAAIQDVRIMFARGADVRVDDEVDGITSRQGEVLFAGRFRIDGPPQFKHNHIEAPLRRVA
jgi:hypothetical protein